MTWGNACPRCGWLIAHDFGCPALAATTDNEDNE